MIARSRSCLVTALVQLSNIKLIKIVLLSDDADILLNIKEQIAYRDYFNE